MALLVIAVDIPRPAAGYKLYSQEDEPCRGSWLWVPASELHRKAQRSGFQVGGSSMSLGGIPNCLTLGLLVWPAIATYPAPHYCLTGSTYRGITMEDSRFLISSSSNACEPWKFTNNGNNRRAFIRTIYIQYHNST